MKKKIDKILFCLRATAGLPSFWRLIRNSRKRRQPALHDPGAPAVAYHIKSGNNRQPLFLRTYDGDIAIFYEIFYKAVYALPEGALQQPKLIVDMGANIGLSALYFQQAYPGATIICVEPEQSNYTLLEKNLAAGITNNTIKPLRAAVTANDGEVLFNKAAHAYNSSISTETGVKVRGISINTLFDNYGITHVDLMKIDIEGAEKYIFSGEPAWLKKVNHVIIEIHSPEDHAICMAAFERFGFTVQPLNTDEHNSSLFWAKV
jgi:FkbM family methyltransferase